MFDITINSDAICRFVASNYDILDGMEFGIKSSTVLTLLVYQRFFTTLPSCLL